MRCYAHRLMFNAGTEVQAISGRACAILQVT